MERKSRSSKSQCPHPIVDSTTDHVYVGAARRYRNLIVDTIVILLEDELDHADQEVKDLLEGWGGVQYDRL